MLEVCSRISLSGQRRHHPCVEDGLVLAVIGRCALVDRLEEEELRRLKVNYSFENFEGQDEISSEASAFQREEVELACDEYLSLAVLLGAGPSQVGLYPPTVLGRWPLLHTLDAAALRHSRVG